MKVLRVNIIYVYDPNVTVYPEHDHVGWHMNVTEAIMRQARFEIDWSETTLLDKDLLDVHDADNPGLIKIQRAGWPKARTECVNVYIVDKVGSSYGLAWRFPKRVCAVSRRIYNLYGGRGRKCTIAHEICHTLGLGHVHPDNFMQADKPDDKYVRWLMAPSRAATTEVRLVYPNSVGNARLSAAEIVTLQETTAAFQDVEEPEEIVDEAMAEPEKPRVLKRERSEEPITIVLKPGEYIIRVLSAQDPPPLEPAQ